MNGCFRYDVGVQAVAKIDGVDIVTASSLATIEAAL